MSGCDQDTTRFAWLRGDPTMGVGWTLQLGYMETLYYQANPTVAYSWAYVSPDGGRHPLIGGAGTVDYTTDGTHLRVTASPSFAQPTQYTVEFPDGSIQTFDHAFSAPQSSPVGSPDFSNRVAGVAWSLEKRFGLENVQDSFGNVALTVSYDGARPGEVQSVVLTPNTQPRTINFSWGSWGPVGGFTWRVMNEIDFPAAAATTAHVDFAYQNGNFPRNAYDISGGSACLVPPSGSTVGVPELRTITLTDAAATFSYPYTLDYWPDRDTANNVDRQGALEKIALPTGGWIHYDYLQTAGLCVISPGGCDPEVDDSESLAPLLPTPPLERLSGFIDRSIAVSVRQEFDSTSGLTGETHYARQNFYPNTTQQPIGPDTRRVVRRVTVKSPGNDGDVVTGQYAMRAYFHVAVPPSSGSEAVDTGTELDRRYYSTDETSGTPVRTIISCYLAGLCGYKDAAGKITVYNSFDLLPKQAEVTWYGSVPSGLNGGTCSAQATLCTGLNNTTLVSTSDSHQIGKYKTTTVTSTLTPMAGWTSRVAVTNWTPKISPRWMLDLYDSKQVTDNGTPLPAPSSVTTAFAFDATDGFLNSSTTSDGTYGTLKRTFTQPDGDGNAKTVEITGTAGVSTTVFKDAATFQAFLPLTTQRTGISTWKSFDVDRDANTGLIKRSRDPNVALFTDYTYDALGRLTKIAPTAAGGDANTFICYDTATGATTTVVRSTSSALPCPILSTATGVLTWQQYRYDGLGRVIREIRKMPSNFSFRTHEYDMAGHETFVSEWASCTSEAGNCTTTIPTRGTTSSNFDPFGRPQTIQRADLTTTTISRTDGTISFSDSREAITQTVSGSSSTTARRFDPLGRVITVAEPAGGGAQDLTTYTYNVLDKVAGVSQGAQGRTFVYDAFGFLRSKTTPEEGTSGNGTATYGSYDALGDVLTETPPGSLAITRVYDKAGRLEKATSASLIYLRNCYDGVATCIDSVAGFAGGTHKLGRLTRRYGYNPAASPAATLTEDFDYTNGAGRLFSKKSTFSNGLTLSTTQKWTYDPLGLVKTHEHPRVSGAPAFTITNTYSRGYPTAVAATGQTVVSSATYNPAGGVASWTAGNGVVTTIAQDVSLLPRPSRISTSGATDASSGLPSYFDSGNYLYDGAGNIISVGSDIFGYDPRSRLTSANYSGIGTESYTYDAFGNQLTKTTLGTTTTFCTTTCTNNRLQGGVLRI